MYKEIKEPSLAASIGAMVGLGALGILFIVGIFGAVIAFNGWITMLLWNWVAVDIFNRTPITFYQGVGISLLLWFVGSFFKRSSKE